MRSPCCLFCLWSWAVAVVALDAGTAQAQDEASQSTEPQPEFKKEEAKGRFEKGQALFKDGKYKKAGKEFKAASRGAASKNDKAIVRKWQDAAKFAPYLDRARRLQKRKQLKKAYDELSALRPHLKGTPADELWQQIAKEIEAELFQPIETFDLGGNYSKKFGKTLIDDPAVVFKGKRCLRWQNTRDRKAGMLKIELKRMRTPPDWTDFQSVEFWVQSPTPVPIQVFLMTDREAGGGKRPGKPKPPSGGKKGEDVMTSFMMEATLASPGQWKKISLDLQTFRAQGDPSFKKVNQFRVQIAAGRQYDILIDEIRLVRKDAQQGKKRGKR